MRKNHPKDMLVNSIHKTNNCGNLMVIGYESSKKVRVRFIDTWFETIATANQIRKGKVKDKLKPSVFGVGIVGDGIYTAKIGKKITDSYVVWRGMISRCYNEEFLKSNQTYYGCDVCEEWQNYQNFAAWYDENHPNDGVDYHLDKDIKVEGNKTYSPEACLFVTANDNAVKANAKRFSILNPDGVKVDFYNLNQFCRDNKLSPSALSLVINGKRISHKGWSRWQS